MIIVSKDKEVAIKFDNSLGAQTLNDKVLVALPNGENICVGEYETEERAKAVLEDIVDRYEYLQLALAGVYQLDATDQNFKYEMPSE